MEGTYAYRAARADGRIETGTVEASTAAAASGALGARGLFPIDVRLAAGTRARRAAISAADLGLGLRVLADLVESGLPIGRALQAIEELAPRAWQDALPHIRQSVKEGKGLAAALGAAPVEIPALVTGIIQAGEAGGGLAPAIRRAAELTESTARMQAAIRSALAYPIVVAIAGIGAIGVLVGVVLPRFATILADLGQTLPSSTRLVLAAATTLREAFAPAAIVTTVMLVAWHAWVRTPAGRLRWHGWLLALPGVRGVRHGLASARAANSLASLLESGVPINVALGFAARASGDAAVESRLLAARERIAAGQAIWRSLDETRATTTTITRLVRAGEESGRVASMLSHGARMEQERADRAVQAGVRMLEPLLMLTFAGLVGTVAAALLQAIYSVSPTA
ncbi:MAG TPA: type II secretion system F family protein [Gemmatimonadaceae bacterium]|nr:type II secretion system F family protein [Gemmatimonadaceae bacterium]